MLGSDGDFVYYPPAGTTDIEDPFTYTSKNDDSKSTARVTITLSRIAFYVDSEADVGGDGTRANPFDTIQSAIDAAQADDTVIVLASAEPYTGEVVLKDGIFDSEFEIVDNHFAAENPTTTFHDGYAVFLDGAMSHRGRISGNTMFGEGLDQLYGLVNITGGTGSSTPSSIVIENNNANVWNRSINISSQMSGDCTIKGNTFNGSGQYMIDLTGSGADLLKLTIGGENPQVEAHFSGNEFSNCGLFFNSKEEATIQYGIRGNTIAGGTNIGVMNRSPLDVKAAITNNSANTIYLETYDGGKPEVEGYDELENLNNATSITELGDGTGSLTHIAPGSIIFEHDFQLTDTGLVTATLP